MILGLLLIVAFVSLGWASFYFYYLFPGSDRLFSARHNLLRHLDLMTDQWSYYPGDEVAVFGSALPGGEGYLTLFRPGTTDTVWNRLPVTLSRQKVRPGVSVSGVNWERNVSLPLPAFCHTGWYVLRLELGSRIRHTSLFVKPKAENISKPVAMFLSTNTWNAYNYWGGQSLYTRNHTPEVSFRRPQLLADPYLPNSRSNFQIWFQAANKDRYLNRLLRMARIECDAYSMTDLHQGVDSLSKYKVLIISTHSEYWTPEMLTHLNEFLNAGGSLVSLSGNTAAYVSALPGDGGSLVVHKSLETLWKTADSTGIRPFGTEVFFDGFHTYAPYRVLADTSWLFAGTGLRNGDLFGLKSDTYDYTQMYGSWIRNLRSFRNRGRSGAASGMEIDKVYAGTPDNWVEAAVGLNPAQQGFGEVYPEKLDWNSEGGADLGYYRHPGGGWVVNASSLAFTGAIPHDTVVQRIVLNAVWKGMGVEPEK
jgi:hypothetical protein